MLFVSFETGLERGYERRDIRGAPEAEVEAVALFVMLVCVAADKRGKLRTGKPFVRAFSLHEQVAPAHKLADSPHAKPRHYLAQLPCHKEHKVHYIFRFAAEAPAKLRILCCYADGASVQIAHPHHHAAHRNERRRGKAEFLCAEHTRHRDIAPCHQLAVGFEPHPVPQPVCDKLAMRLRDTGLPREPGIVNGAFGRGAGTAVKPGNEHSVRTRLGNAGGYRADTVLRNELYGDVCAPVRAFKIVYELRKILDGINIMVRRRGYERNTGGGIARCRHPRVNLLSGEMPALAGLCALRHFYLDLLCAAKISACHPEPAGSDLLYRAVHFGAVAFGRLAALAAVRFAAQAVHRDRHAGMRLVGNGAVRHCARFEALYYFFFRLYLRYRDPAVFVIFEIQQPAERVRLVFIVYNARIFKEFFVIAAMCRLAQGNDRPRGI